MIITQTPFRMSFFGGGTDFEDFLLTDKKADLSNFGRLMDEAWRLKKGMTGEVSTDVIDTFYNKAIQAGALGGKLLGAGGGGFLLFYVEKDRQRQVKQALDRLLYVPFQFENGGSRVIHYTPETYIPAEQEEA